jgi:KRAB domain-containing zinc finger protein
LETHDPNNKGKFICDECQRPFTHLDYLNCHIRRRHSKVKPYSCTYCSKAFAFHHDLNLHITVHTGNKKHVCNICRASFTKAWSLKQHMVQHEVNPTTFNCSECDYSTTSRIHSQKHMQTHNKITYICEECNLEFKIEDELKLHIEETHQSTYTYMDANSSDPYSIVESSY